jgi:HD-like signal output (HDOD) protein
MRAEEKTMAPELEKLFRSAKLFSLPEVYLRVRETLDRPDYHVDEVASSISQDPSLTARLLRVVNSPFFGLVAQIDNVKRAITLLGPRQIHDLVLATVVTASFSRLDVKLVDMRRFWRNSVYCGVIARQLGIRCDLVDSERLFLAGILRDIGHLLMYQQLPELCAQAIKQRQQGSERQLFEIERDLIGYDCAEASGELLRYWTLPQDLWEPILWQNAPEQAETYPLESAIVHMAGVLADTTVDTSEDEFPELPIRLSAWRITNLPPDALPALYAESKQQFSEATSMILGG